MLAALFVALLAGIALVPTDVAGAADPDAVAWTRVTDVDGRNIDEVGVARTEDGALHVLWRKRVAPNQEEIRHTPVSATGSVGATSVASSGWASVGNPAVVVQDDGTLRVFFAGLTGSTASRDGVQSATAPSDGQTWTTSPGRVSSTTSAIPNGVGAAVNPDGTPAFAYAYSFVLGYHAGVNPADPDRDLLPGTKCCAYDPNLVFESDGAGTVGWFSNVEGETGTYVQPVEPAVGTSRRAPESATPDGKAVTPSQRTPIVERAGGGVYVAYCSGYPTCTSVLLWKVGSSEAMVVATGEDIEAVTASPGPDGRIWVVWEDAAPGRLYAARTDTSATNVGGPSVFAPPTGATTVWKLTADAVDDEVDVFAAASVDRELATWHASVLPGLRVQVKTTKKKVVYTVTDAGRAVRGAKIDIGKNKKLTTNRAGRASTSPVKREVTVTKVGYSPTTVTAAAATAATTTRQR